ncbi:MAG: hypothetical protein PVI26_09945 [Chitinispirillia bacterium]|jgi:uncharacterized FlaG/YvyC family protein
MYTLLIAVVMVFITGFNGVAQEKLLPEEDEIHGWTLNDSTLCFNGLAQDCTSLYDVIDGGADKYLDRGFISGIFRGYSNDDGKEICVEIFNQNNKENAQSVYKAFDESEYISYNDIGELARLDTKILSEYNFEMIQDGYFMRFKCPKEDKYRDEMIKIAKLVEQNVRSLPIVNFQNQNNFSKNINISIKNINNKYYKIALGLNSELYKELNLLFINIYNSKGVLIRTLPAKRSGLEYIVNWDGENSSSIPVTQGLYTVSIQFQDYSVSKKVIVQ